MEPHADGRLTYDGVRPGKRKLHLYYSYYYRAVYSSPFLQDFAIVASVLQIRVSATLLVQAGIRFKGEGLVVLWIKIEI